MIPIKGIGGSQLEKVFFMKKTTTKNTPKNYLYLG